MEPLRQIEKVEILLDIPYVGQGLAMNEHRESSSKPDCPSLEEEDAEDSLPLRRLRLLAVEQKNDFENSHRLVHQMQGIMFRTWKNWSEDEDLCFNRWIY